MTLSQTFRTALIAVAGFLLTAVFHTGAADIMAALWPERCKAIAL